MQPGGEEEYAGHSGEGDNVVGSHCGSCLPERNTKGEGPGLRLAIPCWPCFVLREAVYEGFPLFANIPTQVSALDLWQYMS